MGISSKLDEGKIYRFLKTAIKLRSLQRERQKTNSYSMENAMKEHNLEIQFDAQLDAILENVDEVDTERVIRKMSS
jgi:hypothetical protein